MRIAIPKGRLQNDLLPLLTTAGYPFVFKNDRDYRPTTTHAGVTGKLVKVRAIPQLVSLGLFDVGFCGLDLVKEARYDHVEPMLDLGLNQVELVVAVRPEHRNILKEPPRRPLLIASEYERIASEWAFTNKLAHICIQTYGSTEAYAPEDADIVFDCVETGRTIEANGLVIIERLFKSTTHLVACTSSLKDPAMSAEIDKLIDKTREVRCLL